MYKKHIKTALCLLLSCVLALQLAGCAAAPEVPGTTSAKADPAAPGAGTVDLMADIKSLSARTGEKPSPEDAALATDFALRLFRTASEADKNTLLSPISVLCALAMTANGARGETLAQMEQTLGLSREALNGFFHSYLETLSGDKVLKLANSVWFTAEERFTVNRDFLQTNADFYGADVYRSPFDDTTLAAINGWVSEKTDGMIPAILDRIPKEAVMYLVNALAFDAKWAEPYESPQVSGGNFFLENGETRLVDYMHAKEREYLENELAVGFVKPYAGGKYAFAALLPKEGVSLDALVESLDGAALQRLLRGRSSETVFTSLPKFETDYATELSAVLQEMGMVLPFDELRADFTDLGTSEAGNIFISRVIHKTYISVAEEGTRAGAATVVEMTDGEAFVEDPKQVYLDHPFVYLLIDTETCLPLFLGVLRDPG